MATARKGQLCPRCQGGGVVALRPYHINFVEAVLLCPQCPYPLDTADVGDFLLNDHPIDTSAVLANASFGVAVQKEESLSPDKGAQQQASIADKVLSEEEFAFLLGYLRGNESLPSSASAFSSSPSSPSSVSLRASTSSLSSPSSILSSCSSSSSSSGSFSTSSLSLHHLSSSPTSSTSATELLRSVLSSPSAPSSSFSPSTFASPQEHASLNSTLLSSSPSRQDEENRLLASLMMEAHSTSGTDDEEMGFPH
ncbi:hypothetical protein QOT17_007825 [Balamuthia mandrillaris]